MLRDILSYGIGTLVALTIVAVLLFVFVRDITQKKHSVLRNYPVVGRLRYFWASPRTSGCRVLWWWRRNTCASRTGRST